MNFIYKLFGGGGESDDIYNSIPWKEINTISSSDPKMDEIYKKLVLLSTKYKSDLTPQQSPLVMLYKKSLAKKLSPEIVEKLTSEVLESAEPLLEVSKPLVETSKPIEEVLQPKLLNPILSPVCNQDTECKLEFNEIPWKLLQTLTGDDPRTRESLEHLEHLDLHYRDKFDTNTQQLILLYIKTLKKRLGEYRHSTPSPLLTKSDNKLDKTDNKLDKTDNKLDKTDNKLDKTDNKLDKTNNKYCRPFYLEGNRYFCVGTSFASDNDTKRCVFNKDKRVDVNNIDNMDLDPHCENNQEYKSPYQEASI
jgi:hypothetical protein